MDKNSKQKLQYTKIRVDNELSLKQVQPDEAQAMFSIVDSNRDYLSEWLSFPEYTKTVQDSTDFINNTIREGINGSTYGFGIYLNEVLIGHTSLMHLTDGQEPEIGYWNTQQAAGNGIATRTTKALTNFGFNSLNLEKIIIRADPKNVGSNSVAKNAGYTFDGIKNDNRLGLINIWRLSNDKFNT